MTSLTAHVPGQLFRAITWPARHISWKIIFPYVFLTLVLAGVGSYLATNVVTGSLQERFENQLAEAGRVTSDSVVRIERAHLETVRAVTFTQGVSDGIAAGDADTVKRLVQPIAANSAIERLAVLDASGKPLVSLALADGATLTYKDASTSGQEASWPLVQSVLTGVVDNQGDKQAQVIETSDGFVLYTAGPIELNGQLVGVALIGTTVSTFLASTQSQALADVSLYDFNGAPLSSTFVAASGDTGDSEANLTISDPSTISAITSGATVRESRLVWGRKYDFLYSTLQLRGNTVGIYSVALPTDFIFSAGSTTRTQVAALFGIGIVAVLAIGFVLAGLLTRPILRLVRTAARVTSGDLNARSGIRTSDEIGQLAESFDHMTARLQKQHLATIKALTSAIDARDPYTLGHSVRVGQLAVTIGRRLELPNTLIGHLETGGYLHDIGKIGIRDAVLGKPGSLTPEERELINDHPRIGLQILEPVDLPGPVIEFVGSHHERLDGSGYPQGLRADEISIVPRIAAVSDMYDAMTTDRPYRLAMTPEEAMEILRADSAKFLDPDVVRAMREVLEEWERRRLIEPELRGFRRKTPEKQLV
jgi:putative nucleotidyltransferase with HDIG domain